MPATRLLNTKRLLSKLMAMAMAIIQCQAHPPQTRRVKIGRERLKPGICAIRSRPILLFRFCFHRPPFWLSKKFCSLSLSCWQRWRSLLVWTYPLWRESNTSSLRNFQLAGISSLILLANQLHDQMKRSWITTCVESFGMHSESPKDHTMRE